MKKKVILYTGSYPYGKTTESFIGPELNVMSKDLNYDITIVPVVKDTCIRELPNNIRLDNSIVNRGFSYKLKSAMGIFRLVMMKEIWKERKEITSFIYLLQALKYLYATNLVLHNVTRKGASKEPLVFYAFWLSYVPVAFGIYRHQHPDNKHFFVSRGHGIDVYTTDRGVFYPMRNFLYNNIDRVYVCSEEGARYLRNRYPFAADKITRAYLGVVENNRTAQACEESILKVVSCSSVYKFKRVDLILTSLCALCKHYPEYKIEWTHFGGGTLYDELKLIVEKCHIPNLTIILMGAMDNSKILEHYREKYFDFFIHLSTSEGLPVSMMEAIASSIPILATNVGGVSELVTLQSGRLLNKTFTQGEFEDAFRYMVKHRSELAASARAFFDKKFNASRNYPRFYEEISSLKK